MFLIIGLGNPGKQYQNTWHSLGFLAVDEFAKNNNFPDFRLDKKSNSLVSQKENIVLAKPQTFMNDSGRAIKSLITHLRLNYAIATERRELVVVHDDADLERGEMKISQGRGSAGHKGVESIIASLKSKAFIRIRLGSRPKNYHAGSKSLEKFVLRKFTKTEEEIVGEVIEKASEAISAILEKGAEKSMSKFNV